MDTQTETIPEQSATTPTEAPAGGSPAGEPPVGEPGGFEQSFEASLKEKSASFTDPAEQQKFESFVAQAQSDPTVVGKALAEGFSSLFATTSGMPAEAGGEAVPPAVDESANPTISDMQQMGG